MAIIDRNNRPTSYCGEEAHINNHYYVVATISEEDWEAEVLECTDIIISDRDYVHIDNHHPTELTRNGIDAIMYIDAVITNLNEIRYDAEHNSYLLIARDEITRKRHGHKTAIVELKEEYIGYEKVYKIITAHSFRRNDLLKYELLCVKPRT